MYAKYLIYCIYLYQICMYICIHICTTNEVTAFNRVTMGPIHINVHRHTTCLHMCAKFELATTETVACSTVYRTMISKLTYNADNNYKDTTWKCDHISLAEISAELKMIKRRAKIRLAQHNSVLNNW